MDREYIVKAIEEIQAIFDRDNLKDSEILVILSNLVIDASIMHLPSEELSENGNDILKNGKKVNYELLRYPDNLGLQIALKGHLLIDLANKLEISK